MKRIKSQRGFSLIELIVVMTIMAILGTIIVSLMSSGGRFNQNVQENVDAQKAVRIAMSYITTQIRQNDATNTKDKVTGNVVTMLDNDGDLIKDDGVRILRDANAEDNDPKCDIYMSSTNSIVEKIYSPTGTTQITEIAGCHEPGAGGITALKISYDTSTRSITVSIDYDNNYAMRNLTQVIRLRSER